MTAGDVMARDAFEAMITRAGQVLKEELQAADGKTGRREAWDRYGDAQAAAGDAYRATVEALKLLPYRPADAS
jgi:hypothetical protein